MRGGCEDALCRPAQCSWTYCQMKRARVDQLQTALGVKLKATVPFVCSLKNTLIYGKETFLITFVLNHVLPTENIKQKYLNNYKTTNSITTSAVAS